MVTHTKRDIPLPSHDTLDAQHGEIESALRQLTSLPETDTSGEEFSFWMSRFGELLAKHFRAEEEFMRLHGIDEAELKPIKDEHSRLISLHLSVLELMMRREHQSLQHVANQFVSEIMTHISEYDNKYLSRCM